MKKAGESEKRIAIIGAGLTGLVLAHQLRDIAHIELFEKSRGLGGRLSTRYADPYQFDHGAQFFTAKTEAFQAWLKPLEQAGVIAKWKAAFVELEGNKITLNKTWGGDYPHYVGTPKMNQIGKYLSTDLNIKQQTKVEIIGGKPFNWLLEDDKGIQHGPYDWVICTTPAEQATQLLPKSFSGIHHIQNSKMTGCFTLMLGFSEPINVGWEAALVKQSDISWISVNSSKPGRPAGFSIVALSTNAWAEAHMDDDIEHVKQHLLQQASLVTGHDLSHASHISIHRWRYANSTKQPEAMLLLDTNKGLAACGDWCIEGRVEAAFSSATRMADEIRNCFN